MLETHLFVVGTWLRYKLGIWWHMFEVHLGYMLMMLCSCLWYLVEASIYVSGTSWVHVVRHIIGTCMRCMSW
jgi:hypothetical protein